jgi:2-polyprenyl-6-methoxyphenol hydroxylase-like FAD-dependent oxidoreductase
MTAVSNALVVGGGIGGLTAAAALGHQGIAVDLIEATPNWDVYGVGIMQPNNALRDLDKIGVAEECVASGAPFPGWKIYDKQGELLRQMPIPSGAAAHLPPFNGITRPKLQQILMSAARKAGADLRSGLKISELQDVGTHVDVSFTDGSAGSYELVVGCDGIYSDMRRRLFGDAIKPEYAGMAVWRYNLPRPEEVVWSHMYHGPDSKAGLVPLTEDLMYILLVTAEPGNPWQPEDKLADMMRERLDGYGGLIGKLRELIIDPAKVVYKPLESLMLPAPWYKGRSIIIGDAAHAMTPHINQGAAVAVEDAVLLGELMGRDAPLEDLFAEFMDRRYERARYVQESSCQISVWELEHWGGGPKDEQRITDLMQEVTVLLQQEY